MDTTIALLAIAAVATAAWAAWSFHLERQAAHRSARHWHRMWADAVAQRDAARAERDDALDFADESAMLLGLASDPARQEAARRHPSAALRVVQ